MSNQSSTIIVNNSSGTYSEDLAPALEPPAGWRRIDRDQLNPNYCYEHFVWLDGKGNPLYESSNCQHRSQPL